jgi:hypothetical protein
VLLDKEEMVLQDAVDRLVEIGRCYRMEMNVAKTKVMGISRQTSPVQDYDRSKTSGKCGIFQLFR